MFFFFKLRKRPQLDNVSGLIWCIESKLNEGSGHEEFLCDFTSSRNVIPFHTVAFCKRIPYTGQSVY